VTGRADIPIVLCCAEDDEPPLASVVDQLHREGMAPELVTGVELDVATFSASVDEARGPALYVICQSASLDRGMARRLTGLFSARRGAGQRIVTVTFQPGRPLAILPAIRVAFQQAMLAAGEVLDDAASGGAHLRDVVESMTDAPVAIAAPLGMPAPVVRDGPDPDAERLAMELSQGLAEAEAILDRRSEERRESAPASRPRARSGSAAPAIVETPPRARPELARAPQRLPPEAVPHASNSAAPPLPMTLSAALDAVVPSHSGVMRAIVETDPDTSRLPRNERPEPPRIVRGPEESGGNRWLLAAAGLGVAVILALALLQIVQPKDDAVASDRTPAGAGTERAKNDDAAPASAGVQPTAPNLRTLPVADAPVAGDAKAEPSTPVADTPPSTPEIAAPPSDPPPSSKPSSVPPAPPVTSKRDADALALEQAARDGKLTAIGKLYVVKIGTDTTTWNEAASNCRSKSVAGVGGFRLPSRGELRRLRSAKVLDGASYWSRDKGEAGDEAFTVDGGSGNEVVYLIEEPNGAAICVRAK
jgi:hypothetical protein